MSYQQSSSDTTPGTSPSAVLGSRPREAAVAGPAGEIETILAATSLSPTGDHVVETAVRIAEATGARVHLLHAYSEPITTFTLPTGLAVLPPRLLEANRERCQKLLDQQLRRLRASIGVGENVIAEDATIVAGAPHSQLAAKAEKIRADLVVIGAADESRTGVLGSTTDRVLRSATQPVLVVRRGLSLPLRRVVAPVDLSSSCGRSLRCGMSLIRQLAAPEMRGEGLFVLPPRELEIGARLIDDPIEETARRELERFLAAAGARAIEPVIAIGEPRIGILDHLRRSSVDLALIGTHGRSRLERFLLGNVATYVARSAPCSVLVVPPPGRDGHGNGAKNGNGNQRRR